MISLRKIVKKVNIKRRKMARIKISTNFYLPMPTTIVGMKVKGRPNFCAVGWISRVNYKPPMIAIALYKSHYSPIGIKDNKTFSICIPETNLVKETDYCGIASGKKVDKSKFFTIFYGETKTAPMIEECPVNIECKLYKTITLPDDYLFIGRVVNVYVNEKFLTKGKIDYKKIKPFIFLIPPNIYSSLGKNIGKAYSTGKSLGKNK
jgi:flavin reductase (DIM6/NTAB) family NADH-FMN oxidoreductase RutF